MKSNLRKRWKSVELGSAACIVAPSYGITAPEKVEEEYVAIGKNIKAYGFKTLLYPDIFVPGNHTLFNSNLRFANSDEVRASHFLDALRNPQCDFIWMARGGYGFVRLLKYLLPEAEPLEVKAVVGFSDITIAHSFLAQKWGWSSVHFSMPSVMPPVHFQSSEYQRIKGNFHNILAGGSANYLIDALGTSIPSNSIINGVVYGGNLFNIQRLFGTVLDLSLDKAILVLEDTGEAIRKIDGFLEQISLRPDFKLMSAIIFGNFTELDVDHAMYHRVIQDFSQRTQLPVFEFQQAYAIGHGQINNPIALNREATISASETGYILQVSGAEVSYASDDL